MTTSYQYDQINRLKRTDYSDGTPYTTLTYDFAINGRGRLHHDYESSATGQINVTGSYDAMGRATQRRTLFYVAGSGWTGEYVTNRSYDYAGNVLSQTYPSGRTVSYQYDNAGRTNHFAGNLGDAVQRTYSTAVQYDAASRVTREQFGTQTALYHKLKYNVRGQLYDVRLSSVNDTEDANRGCVMYFIGSWNLGESGTTNNGNIWGVRHWSPEDDAGSSFTNVQENYEYDSLNRVTRAYGYHSAGGHQYTQAFDYDRWGNRQINQGLTWGTGINNRQFTIDANTNRLGVPAGQSGTISYDAAGNQTEDSYSGWGSRDFDGENRLTVQRNTSSQEIGRYTYDAGGRRVRRNTSGVVTWYVHGIDGELIAEYTASQPQTNPLTEYGYRNGEMLVTASAPAATQSATFAFTSTRDGQREIYQLNADGTGLLRLTDNAATDDHADYSPDSQRLAFTSWRDGQEEIYVMNADGTNLVRVTNHAASDINAAWSPDGTRLVFASDRDGDHEIYTVNPDGTNLTQLTFNTSFDARPDWGSNNQIAFRSDRDGNAEIYTMNSDGSNQVNRTNNPAIDAAPVWSADGSQVAFVSQRDGNNEIYVMTADGTNPVNRTNHAASDASPDWSGDGVSILWMTTRDGQHEIYKMEVDGSNVVRLTNHVAQETMPVWRPVVGGGSSGGGVRWLVTDQLGTPRMTIDQTGSLASVRRHDYLPFGEDVGAGIGGRTAAQGYQPDNIRQQFTGYERDGETGLDYAQARYYASVQGRFVSVDPLMASANTANPQTWNRYAYVLNNPLRYIDPLGMFTQPSDKKGGKSQEERERRVVVVVFTGGSASSDGNAASRITRVRAGGSTEGLGEASLTDVEGESIAQRIKNGFPQTEVILAGPTAQPTIFNDLATNRPDNIIIEGFSSGATSAIALTNNLTRNGQNVDQLTTVDAPGITRLTIASYNIRDPERVSDAMNFVGPLGKSVGGAINVNITEGGRQRSSTPLTHGNADDIVSPRVVNRIEGRLRLIYR